MKLEFHAIASRNNSDVLPLLVEGPWKLVEGPLKGQNLRSGWRVARRTKSKQEDKMSVFGSIVSAIFGSKHAASATAAASSSAPSAGSAKGTSAPSPSAAPAPGTSAPSAGTSTAAPAKPISKADVEDILAKLADEQDEDYDWKRSIVDLMKLLKLDSGLGARKQLAQELGYTGALDGSAEMNVWLHKQVMTKLAETGGKVPDSLKT